MRASGSGRWSACAIGEAVVAAVSLALILAIGWRAVADPRPPAGMAPPERGQVPSFGAAADEVAVGPGAPAGSTARAGSAAETTHASAETATPATATAATPATATSLMVLVRRADGTPFGEGAVYFRAIALETGVNEQLTAQLGSDGRGPLKLDARFAGTVQLVVAHTSLGPEVGAPPDDAVVVDLAQKSIPEPEFRLVASPEPEIRVLDAGGTPVQGAGVTLDTRSRGCGRGGRSETETTDSGGVARFGPHWPAIYQLTAHDPRTLAAIEMPLHVRAGLEPVTVRLPPPPPVGAVEVSFVDGAGAPVAVSGDVGHVTLEAPTASAVVAPLAAGRARVGFDLEVPDGFAEPESLEVEVRAGALTAAKVHLRRLGRVELTVEGAPPGRSGYVSSRSGDQYRHQILTGPRLTMPGFGPTRLEVRIWGFARVERELEVPEGEPVPVTVALTPEVSLEVEAFTTDGIDLAQRSIVLTRVGGNASQSRLGDDGTVRFTLPEPGAYDLCAGSFLERVEVGPAGARVVIDLSGHLSPRSARSQNAHGVVIVAVVDSAGARRGGAVVVGVGPHDDRESEPIQGSSDAIELRPGAWRLAACDGGHAEGPSVEVTVVTGKVARARLVLGPALDGWIVGRVTGLAAGVPPPHTVRAVEVRDPGPIGPADEIASLARLARGAEWQVESDGAAASPDRGGAFALGPLPGGRRMRVEIDDPAFEPAAVEVLVGAGERVPITLPVRARTLGRLAVAGSSIAEVSIEEISSSGEPLPPGAPDLLVSRDITPRAPGAPIEEDLPAGRYRVRARFAGDAEEEWRFDGEVTVQPGRTARLEVRRTVGSAAIEGLLVSPGDGVRWGYAEVIGPGIRRPLDAGRPFRLDELPPGTYRIARQNVQDRGAALEVILGAGEMRDLGPIELGE